MSSAISPRTRSSTLNGDTLAARPGRQTPQRPIRAAAPQRRNGSSPTGPPTHPPVDGCCCTTTAADSTGITSAGSSSGSRRDAGLGHVHPHQLRHTLATQAINRGMRLEAIATMLGHRSLRMTLTYARIANKTVADEYADRVSEDRRALHQQRSREQRLQQLAGEHRRMLANGWCNRPAATDCIYETICEGCGYYQTTHRVPADPARPSRPRRTPTTNPTAPPSTTSSSTRLDRDTG